ncbi:hypothetical protein ACJMK2_035707 [Sinanodonta woodiana]|uniref:Carboxypeptidase n=1 Tax=Sinanodonta woodiana TaxID=1069815 RepID=A0ABD3WVR0_SINWO
MINNMECLTKTSSVFLITSFFMIYALNADTLRYMKHKQGDDEPKQEWDYVDVRSYAHMFFWLYYTTDPAGYEHVPLVMWLQGGPGGSSTGFGNFAEIGPLDIMLKPRNTTWLSAASLLFVDNPVGAGFSYVDNDDAYTTNVDTIAKDLLVLLKTFFMEKSTQFQSIPFFIFSESYGGKMTAAISDVLYQAITKGDIKCNFKGIAMGDSWISPIDSTLGWGSYLYTNSLIDLSGYLAVNSSLQKVAQAIQMGDWTQATEAWGSAQDVVEQKSNGVNFYNILQWGGSEPTIRGERLIDRMTRRMLGRLHNDPLSDLMNGPIRRKLKIIPEHVVWGGQSDMVFQKQTEDFMKPVTDIVNSLIMNTTLKVVVYSGQLDLIVETTGTEAWVYRLDIAENFRKATRIPVFNPATKLTSGFVQSAKNFSFYWILDAGHMVPSDNGDTALAMLKMVIEMSSTK